MDKMWPSFLKDGDTLNEAADLFIKSVSGTKTNNGATCLSALRGKKHCMLMFARCTLAAAYAYLQIGKVSLCL